MLLEQVAQTSAAVAQTAGRKKKTELIGELLAGAPADERAIAARYLSGDVGRKLGIGYATVGELRDRVAPAAAASLSLAEVDRRFAAIAAASGSGSARAHRDGYGALLAAATAIEQGFLDAIGGRELRQGAARPHRHPTRFSLVNGVAGRSRGPTAVNAKSATLLPYGRRSVLKD